MAECSGSVVSNNVNIQKQSSAVQSTDSADEDKTDKVMEPMLLEDFKYKEEPRSLLNLLQYFETNELTPNKNDILVGLVYILMLESGFVPVEHKESHGDYNFNYQRVLRLSQQLPSNWKRSNAYSFSLVLPQFDKNECKVACVVLGDDVLVNCMVADEENSQFNTMLDTLTYFISSTTDIKCTKLQNLKYLSRLVKNEVCYPAKQAILRDNDVVDGCLEALPPEIILEIMKYLKIQDVVHLGQTNSRFYELMTTPELWLKRLRTDFDINLPLHTYSQLKDYYKHSFTARNSWNLKRAFWLN